MLFADNTMARMSPMRSAYILTAAIIALCGAAGYFKVPGAGMFVRYDRALGAFKDPNVYGPFLILPLLFLIERMLSKRIDFLSSGFNRHHPVRPAAPAFARRMVSTSASRRPSSSRWFS